MRTEPFCSSELGSRWPSTVVRSSQQVTTSTSLASNLCGFDSYRWQCLGPVPVDPLHLTSQYYVL